MVDFYVNTDLGNYPEDYIDVLKNNEVYAHRERKNALDKIKPGDRIFVYHTEVGFLGYGIADCCAQDGPPGMGRDEFRFVSLRDFNCKADPDSLPFQGVTSAELNKLCGTKCPFRGTCGEIQIPGVAKPRW